MEGRDDGQPDIVDIIVQKNREGEVGTRSVLFEKEYSRMTSLGVVEGVKYERSDFTPPE
jgi:replicative DNA helicase